MNKIYFISGVSGVGKSAIIPHLKTLLPSNFEVHDFDERGVPTGATHAWRLDETKHWMSEGQTKAGLGIALVVCGFFNPDEIQELVKDFSDIHIITILLDGRAEIIEQRLRARNSDQTVKADLERVVGSADAFIENNTKFVPILREICLRHACPVVDTTDKDPIAVAQEISKLTYEPI